MKRKKLKKYKIAVGICGPHILYTNIIKAYSEEEAVKKYMEESEEEFNEERYQMYLRHTFEHIPKPRKKKTDAAE